jgi:hypothetical protein
VVGWRLADVVQAGLQHVGSQVGGHLTSVTDARGTDPEFCPYRRPLTPSASRAQREVRVASG